MSNNIITREFAFNKSIEILNRIEYYAQGCIDIDYYNKIKPILIENMIYEIMSGRNFMYGGFLDNLPTKHTIPLVKIYDNINVNADNNFKLSIEKRDNLLGMTATALNGEEYTVIGYYDNCNIMIQFKETGYITKITTKELYNGHIKDKYLPIGRLKSYFGDSIFKINKKVKNINPYNVWCNLLRRIYNANYNEIINEYCTRYVGINIDPIWLNYQYFAFWYYSNYYLVPENSYLNIDKDLISLYNNIPKIYSPKTCLLLPVQINYFITERKYSNHILPGVIKTGGVYYAINDITNQDQKEKIPFSTPEEAFQFYKQYKEKSLHQLVNTYCPYMIPEISELVYNMLTNMTINENGVFCRKN